MTIYGWSDVKAPTYSKIEGLDTDWSNSPRLVIEEKTEISSKLSDSFFFVKKLLKKEERWHLRSHSVIGNFIDGKSTAVWMFNKYKKIIKSKHYFEKGIRLRLLSLNKPKLILQDEYEDCTVEEYINEQKYDMPCSGIMPKIDLELKYE